MGQMNQQTNSVKALKEVVVLRIRLQCHQVHLTMLQYYTVHMHAMYSQTQNNTYTKMNLSTVKWPSIRRIQELHRHRWLRYYTHQTQISKSNCTALRLSCVYSLAVITPSVFSTVYGCYLTGVQIKNCDWYGFLMCSLVTSWLCDRTRVWRVDW